MHRDPWTQECDEQLRRWHEDGVPLTVQVQRTGRTPAAVYNRRRKLGLRGGSPQCLLCGAPLEQKAGRPRLFCSQKCSNWWETELRYGHQGRQVGACPQCGQAFERGPKAIYCSRRCSQRAWYERAKAVDGSMAKRYRRTARYEAAHAG